MKFARLILLVTATLFAATLSLLSGSAGVDLSDPATLFVITEIRLPRVIAALAVGITSAIATVLLQLALRSQVAEPALFGVTGFAALGTIFSLVLGFGFGSIWSWTFASVMTSLGLIPLVLISNALIRKSRRSSTPASGQLPILGIAIGAFALGVLGLLASVAPDPRLRSLTFWAFGSLSIVTLEHAVLAVALALLLAGIAFASSRYLSPLALGESWMRGMGISSTSRLGFALLLVALMSATSSFTTGSISFIGLLAATIVRQSMNLGLRAQLMYSSLVATLTLLVCDLLARTLAAPVELGLGIFTALIGVPVLIWSLLRGAKNA